MWESVFCKPFFLNEKWPGENSLVTCERLNQERSTYIPCIANVNTHVRRGFTLKQGSVSNGERERMTSGASSMAVIS